MPLAVGQYGILIKVSGITSLFKIDDMRVENGDCIQSGKSRAFLNAVADVIPLIQFSKP